MFFILPYIIIKLTNREFKYIQYEAERDLIGLVMLCISNCIIFFMYKLFKIKLGVKNIYYRKKVNIIKGRILVYIKWIIYILVIFSFLFCTYNILDVGINNIDNNMILRTRLSKLGPFAIILMFPLGISTYYWMKIIDGYTEKYIKIKVLFFTFIAFTVAFFRGQRTDLILIVLFPTMYIFIKNRKIKLLIYSALGVITFAAVYAIYFKVNTQGSNQELIEMIGKMVTGEFDRNWTYWISMDQATLTANNIMGEPYAGYIYTLLTYLPRSIAPFKGYSTESYFVYFMGNNYVSEWWVHSLAEVNWGITLAGITEALINGGYIGVVFFSVIIGTVLSIMDRICNKYKYLKACIPFIVILMSGYTLYNIIVIYSPIILTMYIFNKENVDNSCFIKI